MRKKNLICILISSAVTLLLPFLAVRLVRSDVGMAVCFVLFFAINPLMSLLIGMFAGRHLKLSWYLPFLCSALFLAGAWLVFDMGEPAFLLYAAIYLIIGILAMAATALLRRRNMR